jgi:hypothetical protein
VLDNFIVTRCFKLKSDDEKWCNLLMSIHRTWGNKLSETLRLARNIVYAVSRQLSWAHFRILIYLNDDLSCSFYLEMTKVEKWSPRALKQ